jgi:carotenoid cleavage dioxygenase-like enzyme
LRGALPAGLSGRLIAICPDKAAGNVIAFGGSLLALGDGSLAFELTSNLGTLRRVDLAGHSRGVAAYPKRDPITGDLHVLAVTDSGVQAHVVVSSSAFTRTSRTIAGAPNPIKDLVVTRDRVVFVADGFVGRASRGGEANPTWIATDVDAPYLVSAHDAGDVIIVYTVTSSLERWTLHADAATLHREILDATPRHFARASDRLVDAAPRFVWTTGDSTADKYDLSAGTHISHTFRPDRAPGDFVFVADAARPRDEDGGWLVGFVHHAPGNQTDLVVLDAADIAAPALATVTIPRRVPRGHHSTWIASSIATGASQDFA